ncbi:hypothetical protein [Bacillus mycoides]|uniref:Uncharacterized protein n=1 Tax=Bacillus mycoides (strain KBAB4) TaxID=315730 RepID=A9VVN6_BACMK|nr:hypothetical protein [Bacillus mycoides]ABY46851.1 hypothetical protein BcerKBAB4_5357 [Bacillus mycoides KBAB4]
MITTVKEISNIRRAFETEDTLEISVDSNYHASFMLDTSDGVAWTTAEMFELVILQSIVKDYILGEGAITYQDATTVKDGRKIVLNQAHGMDDLSIMIYEEGNVTPYTILLNKETAQDFADALDEAVEFIKKETQMAKIGEVQVELGEFNCVVDANDSIAIAVDKGGDLYVSMESSGRQRTIYLKRTDVFRLRRYMRIFGRDKTSFYAGIKCSLSLGKGDRLILRTDGEKLDVGVEYGELPNTTWVQFEQNTATWFADALNVYIESYNRTRAIA